MQTVGINIHKWRTRRHWLRNGLTILAETLIWAGCVYAATLAQGAKPAQSLHPSSPMTVLMGWGFAILLFVTYFIHNNAFSRTARRDEVVACAMKTALAFCVLNLVVFTERTSLQILCYVFFAVALTVERLIVNNWFIRYCTQPAHSEHGVIICREGDTAQQALQRNTYGLMLSRLEMGDALPGQDPLAQRLAAYLTAHKETTSVYCSPSVLSPAEMETVAHTCREQGVVLHLLPLPTTTFNPSVRNECRGTICVLSPAKRPLRSMANRAVKRLTDIVLSLLILLTVFPPFALVAFIYIKRQSHGPLLTFRHMCGMNGKPFRSLTFRTRHFNAAPSFLDGTDDPGYFPFGKFLSRTRLELLPQFLSVLAGGMSIVGSQAMTPESHANYRRELQRLFASGYRLKAGITSYQFPGQTEGSPEADVWYCRNWGFWLDVRIMLRRLGTLLSRSKAKSIIYI